MYSQNDLDEAVRAGALSAQSATSLRAFVAQRQALPAVDEEHFRLLTGFNDIFVSIAAVILLFALAWIGQSIGNSLGLRIESDGPSPIGALLVAGAAWGLALFFTAKRRMALPSILLLLAFVGGIFFTVLFALVTAVGAPAFDDNTALAGVVGAAAATVAAIAAWLHWRTFRVPITVAAGTAAAAGIAIGLLIAAIGRLANAYDLALGFTLLLGVGVFLFAMRWDSSDPGRVTRRSDVAFWLHLLAAPMIVHPVFALMGLTSGSVSVGEGLVVIAVYVVLAVAALAVDRRALLVSALAYVLYALKSLFDTAGAIELSIALTALVIGSALLLLSAFWHQARALIVNRLPEALQARLPLLDRPAVPAAA